MNTFKIVSLNSVGKMYTLFDESILSSDNSVTVRIITGIIIFKSLEIKDQMSEHLPSDRQLPYYLTIGLLDLISLELTGLIVNLIQIGKKGGHPCRLRYALAFLFRVGLFTFVKFIQNFNFFVLLSFFVCLVFIQHFLEIQ